MNDLLREFVTETTESLALLDVELVRLEQNPEDPALIGSIFRLVHTIKGTCGFIGLPRLEHVAHAGENVLGKFRDKVLPVTPQAVSLILKAIDKIKYLIGELETNEAEAAGSDEELIAELDAMASGKAAVSTPALNGHTAPVVADAPEPDEFGFVPVMAGDMDALGRNMGAEPAINTALIESPPAPIAVATPAPPAKAGEEQVTRESAVAGQSIRVDVQLLENLMTTVSELVLTRNQLLQILRSQTDTAFTVPLQRLNQVTSELQESVMKTRMQPIGNAWSKLPRIVRDISVETNKKIDLQMLGAETELDRQVLELIKDPLTHMVRNSGDHGIEPPVDRLKAGKPETGVIRLNAYHEGGHIVIEIADDGRGLALDKIKAKAVQNGLATEAELAGMSDQQVMQFIFKPGFSTAAKVTSISGRGVGMDVVRTNIEKIGGTIEMHSTLGKGSRFLIKIPLTLAIVSALIVESANELFAIPQTGVIELVQASQNGPHRIERINGTPVLRLRNTLLPLIVMRDALKLGCDNAPADHQSFVVVVQVGNTACGIIVDKVHDTEEIVVKPLSPILRHLDIFSGNTILGDGTVIMILDLNGVVTRVKATGHSAEHDNRLASAHAVREEEKESLLLFTIDGEQKAVPLSLVARLEEIEAVAVEHSGEQAMVQYRGGLMPLIRFNGSLPASGKLPIVVFTERQRSLGLVVDEVVDIVQQHLQIDLGSQRPGCLGTAIIAGRATDIVDTTYYLEQGFRDWFGVERDGAFESNAQRRILLVDDSTFFLNLIKPQLTVAGYNVVTAGNPAEALKLHEAGEQFDAIISDIEMPGMNGFDFVSALRRDGRWAALPMLAMSSHATPQDIDRGMKAGFTTYVAKNDCAGMLTFLKNCVHIAAAANPAALTNGALTGSASVH